MPNCRCNRNKNGNDANDANQRHIKIHADAIAFFDRHPVLPIEISKAKMLRSKVHTIFISFCFSGILQKSFEWIPSPVQHFWRWNKLVVRLIEPFHAECVRFAVLFFIFFLCSLLVNPLSIMEIRCDPSGWFRCQMPVTMNSSILVIDCDRFSCKVHSVNGWRTISSIYHSMLSMNTCSDSLILLNIVHCESHRPLLLRFSEHKPNKWTLTEIESIDFRPGRAKHGRQSTNAGACHH